MNPRNSIWFRLTALARLAPDDARDEAAPHGFSTRVAALAFSRRELPLSALLARFSWRGLAIAALLMAVSVAAGYNTVSASLDREDATALNDPVGDMLNLS